MGVQSVAVLVHVTMHSCSELVAKVVICVCVCVCACRDLVHRQTACWAVKHMALGVYGFGFEDAMTHLFNLVWPNMFEVSPHMVQAFTDAVDGMRVSVGPGKVLSYLLQVGTSVCCMCAGVLVVLAHFLQGLFHPARKVRDAYWRIYNDLYIGAQVLHTPHVHTRVCSPWLPLHMQDALVAAYPRVPNDERNKYIRYELDYFL